MKGEEMFVVDGQFVCERCADENGNVCDCGNFKNDGYETCYDCYQDDTF